MDIKKQELIIQRVFENLEKQKSKQDADGLTSQIDTHRYVSKERFRAEQKAILQKQPIVVAAEKELLNAGDYVLNDSTGLPILIVKGKDGQIRAFLNMCRHRGVRLLQEEKGHIKRNIVCPYHAWSYDTAGCLKAVFHEQGFNNVSSDTHSLIALDCWLRLGMVFVLPDPQLKGSIDIDEWLKEVYMLTEGFDFGACHPYYHTQQTLNCNWKLIVDGALEGYHFKIAHAQTIGPYFLDNMSINMDNQFHSSIIFPKKAMKKFQDLPVSQWNFRKAANILIHIFPNTIILIEPDHIMVVCLYPIDEKTTEAKSFMLLPSEPITEKEKSYWDLNGDIFWKAINEDNEMAELQQKSFNGHSLMPMVVGSYEKLLLQLENLVDKILNETNSHQ